MTVKMLSVSMILISNALANDSNAIFEQKRIKMLDNVSGQIAALESAKKCIETATSEDVLQKCFEVAVAERKRLK